MLNRKKDQDIIYYAHILYIIMSIDCVRRETSHHNFFSFIYLMMNEYVNLMTHLCSIQYLGASSYYNKAKKLLSNNQSNNGVQGIACLVL